jgi:hypothetical protein
VTPRFGFLLLALLSVAANPARGGWVSIKNETTHPVIVQDICTVNNQTRRGKPIKLMPGETLREYQATAGTKTVQVLEPGLLVNRLLVKGDLEWKLEDKSFVIRKDGDAVKVQPTPPPPPIVVAEKK